jgi:fatty acid desaturase
MYHAALGQIVKGNWRVLLMWLTHLSCLLGLLLLVNRIAGIGAWHYVLGIAYPALSIAMVRSYYEHRAAGDCKHRIVINEASWLMRLLYLNNNYHLVHHDLPSLPWYLIARVYQANRQDYLLRSGQFLVPGYGHLLRRFGLKAVDHPVHPASETLNTP